MVFTIHHKRKEQRGDFSFVDGCENWNICNDRVWVETCFWRLARQCNFLDLNQVEQGFVRDHISPMIRSCNYHLSNSSLKWQMERYFAILDTSLTNDSLFWLLSSAARPQDVFYGLSKTSKFTLNKISYHLGPGLPNHNSNFHDLFNAFRTVAEIEVVHQLMHIFY